MKTHIKTTKLDLTPSLEVYVESKLGTLSKFVNKFEEEGVAELWIELARTTRHHYKGDVFLAEADLRLPGVVLRGEALESDIHAAIDKLRTILRMEIEKYKTKKVNPRRARV